MASQNPLSEPNATVHPTETLPSTFELLPAEIRHMIYGYLGFPITGKMWFPIHRESCNSYWKSAPQPRRPSPADFEYELVRLTKVQFVLPFEREYRRLIPILYCVAMDTGKVSKKQRPARMCSRWNPPCDYCKLHEAFLHVAASMMGVNRRIHAELCELLYGKICVEFDFTLRERAVHHAKYQWKRLLWWKQYNEDRQYFGIGFARSTCSITTMFFLTHVSLGPDVGSQNTKLTLFHRPAFCARVLHRQADSIRYVATHCHRLVTFKYAPNYVALQVCKQHTLNAVANAFKDLVEKHSQFQTLEIMVPRYQCFGISPNLAHISGKDVSVREILTVAGLPQDASYTVENWAKSVLSRIRQYGAASGDLS